MLLVSLQLQLYAEHSDNLELQDVEYSHDERGFAFREGRSDQNRLTLPLLTTINILMNVVFALARHLLSPQVLQLPKPTAVWEKVYTS